MINRIAIEIFGIKVYWYGIVYALGFLFTYFFIIYYSKNLKIKRDELENIILYTMIFSIIGARLFEILIYNFNYYLANPIKIFALWEGGMSIHGGILGGFIAILIFSKKYKINPLKITDIIVIPLSFFLAIGRIANMINQELVGKPTTSNLGVIFPSVDNLKRWPYQIFASIQNIITFQILFFLYIFKKLKTGTITALFLIIYGFSRFFLDFIREDVIYFGPISIGQILSLIYATTGIILLIIVNRNNEKENNIQNNKKQNKIISKKSNKKRRN